MSTALMRRIEREALKAAKQSKKVFKLTQQSAKRKSATRCANCGIEGQPLRRYFDDSNIAITHSSKPLCPGCFAAQYRDSAKGILE